MTIAPQNIIADLRGMSDQQLSQYAQMHQNDPYVFPLAFQESQTRQQMRSQSQAMMAGQKPPTVVQQDVGQMAQSAMPQMPYAPMGAPAGMPQQAQPQQPQTKLPEEQGIGALSAKNLEGMKGGGIVEHFDEGGLSRDMAEMVLAKAKKYGIDPNIAMRMVRQESQFNPKAESKVGAAGLTQLMPNTAKEMGMSPEDRYDPEKSLEGGFKYLNKLRNQYGGDYEKALAAYNWGQGHVNKHLAKNDGTLNRTGLPKETAQYLNKIMPGSTAQAAEVPSTPTAQAAPTLGRGEKLSPDGAYVVDAMGIPLRKANIPANPNSAAAQSQAYSGQGVQPRSQFQAMKDAARWGLGAGETALQVGTGLAAIPTAGYSAVARQLPNVLSGRGANTAEMEQDFLDRAGQVTFQPRTAAGQDVSEGLVDLIDSSKIPPYMAMPGNLSQRAGFASIAGDLGELAKVAERKAGFPSAQNPRGILRLAGPSTDTTMIQDPNGQIVRNGPAMTQYASDVADAINLRKAAANAAPAIEGTLPETLERNAQMDRMQNVATASSPAIQAASASPGIDSLMGGNKGAVNMGTATGDDLSNFYSGTPNGSLTKDAAIDQATKQALPTTGMDKNEMLLMLGLGLMGGQSPNALTNLGQAGIGALKYGQESKKDAAETAYKQAIAQHYGVTPEIQNLEYFKNNPEALATLQARSDAAGNAALMKSMVDKFISDPTSMDILKQSQPQLYEAIANQAKMATMPSLLGGLPGAGANIRAPL